MKLVKQRSIEVERETQSYARGGFMTSSYLARHGSGDLSDGMVVPF